MISANQSQLEDNLVQRRIVVAVGLVTLLAVLLVGRLAYLQIAQQQRFSMQAQDNRIHFAPVPAVRGLIRDRNGVVLAENIRAYRVEIMPEQVEDMEFLLHELGQLIDLSAHDVRRYRALLARRATFEWQILRANLNEQEAARIALNQHRYPGVALRASLQRHYPQDNLTAHTIGYVGRISAEDLETDPHTYRGFDYIGRSGLEAHHEALLRGKAGIGKAEINAHGRVVRRITQTAPQVGQNLHLSLDIELQRKSVQALQGYEGAIVALEPHSGEVLAFASAPDFDPNLFVNGISETEYSQLRDAPGRPLVNRALYGRYAPGSTIKGFMLLAGLESGIDPQARIFCRGWYRLPKFTHRYRDWKEGGHGNVDAHDSVVQSCDVYFYQLAEQLGIDRIRRQLSRFGFGAQTGLDLPLEPSGLLPSPQWKHRTRGQAWFPGDTVVTGIGQGYMLVTPLQLAVATAMLANRGKRVVPRFIAEIENPQTHVRQRIPPKIKRVEKLINGDSYAYIIAGMRDVVHGERGTARGIRHRLRYQMAGKTGTTQVKSIPQNETQEQDIAEIEKKFRDHSLFIAFAPLDDPKIAIAVVVEHAGNGSRVAAPIARKLLDYYLIERLGMFQETADLAATK